MNSWETGRRIQRLNRNLNVVGLAGVLTMLGLAYTVALRPLMADSADHEQKLKSTQAFLKDTAGIAARTRETISKAAELDQEMTRILAGVPDTPQESEFLRQVAGLAQGTSLAFDEFRPGSTTVVGKYRQTEISLRGTGTYQDICRFLAGLESLPRLCRVQRLQIQTADDQKESLYPVSMTLVIFFAPEDTLTTSPHDNEENV